MEKKLDRKKRGGVGLGKEEEKRKKVEAGYSGYRHKKKKRKREGTYIYIGRRTSRGKSERERLAAKDIAPSLQSPYEAWKRIKRLLGQIPGEVNPPNGRERRDRNLSPRNGKHARLLRPTGE